MIRLKRFLRKIYALYIKRDKKEISYYKYIDDGGESLRLDYPLNKKSIIIDVGGYIGDFAVDMTNKYDCYVDVFEPVSQYAEKIKSRLSTNHKVNLIQAGLGATEREETITIEGLGSSIFVEGREEEDKETIKILSIIDFLQSKNSTKIDLIKMNIEGGEFELFNALLDYPELMKMIKYFQIQFHDFVPDAENKRVEIQKRLSKTHKLMWNYPFIWESWELK